MTSTTDDPVSASSGQSLQRRILVATVTVGILTAGAKVGVGIRELVVAKEFGAGHEVDAFLIAFALPLFAINIVAGAVPSALVPVLVRRRTQHGKDATQALVAQAIGATAIGLVALTLLLALVSPILVRLLGSGLSSSDVSLATTYFLELLPIVVLAGVSAVAASVINADERFAVGASVQLLNPLAAVIVLLLLSSNLGIKSLVLASLAGYLVEFVVSFVVMRSGGWSIAPRFGRLDADARAVVAQFLPMAGATLLTGTNLLVDQSVASTAGVGAVAHLAYGSRIVSLVLQVVAFALATVLLPHFSRLIAEHDWSGLRRTLRSQSMLIGAVSLPITAVLILGSRTIVRLAFQRGAFSAEDAEVVSHVQALYALQLGPHMVGIVWVRLLSALQASRQILVITVANLVVNVVADLLLVRWLDVEGIALSTSIVYTFSVVLIGFALRARLRGVR